MWTKKQKREGKAIKLLADNMIKCFKFSVERVA